MCPKRHPAGGRSSPWAPLRKLYSEIYSLTQSYFRNIDTLEILQITAGATEELEKKKTKGEKKKKILVVVVLVQQWWSKN